MSDCLNSGSPDTADKLSGIALILGACIPFTLSARLLYQFLRKRPLGKITRGLAWLLTFVLAALGVFQILNDFGDAIWSGIPLVFFAIFLGMSVRYFPISDKVGP